MNTLPMFPFVRAMGWALIHFLWQGALLGLAAWLVLRLLRRRSPALRYRFACAFLAAMGLAFVSTALLTWTNQDASTLPAIWAGSFQMDVSASPGFFAGWNLRPLLESHFHGVLLVWAVGCLGMLVRFGAGLGWLYGSCLRQAHPAETQWTRRLSRLCVLACVERPVRLMVSDQVDSPLVLGWWRPIILVPAAVFLSMDPLSLEAVLTHELSHIRRNDFLMNLLQGLAEVVLFYHPAVWWISRQIRREREHCCDDAAIRLCGDSLLYASALARLEELRSIPTLLPILAPAARGGSLMSRIQRMLSPNVVPGLPLPGSLALLLALSLLGATTLLASGQEASKKPTPVAKEDAGDSVEVDFAAIKIIKQPPMPPYPEEAKENKIQGAVVVSLNIDTQGKVVTAKALSGPEELRAAAVDYAKQWEFEPCKIKGEAKPARFKLTLKYVLR